MKKKSYHDYVIKEGKFIGDFENMYRDCEDPWMQSKQPNKYARMGAFLHIRNFNIKTVVEWGCGLGYYADWLYRETGIKPKSLDLSEEAVNRARKLFPHLDFEKADIATDFLKYRDYDCILFSEIIWYILPTLDKLIKQMQESFKGKYLLVNQVFYKGTQKYGVEYFTAREEFVNYLPFELVAYCEATTINDSTIETSNLFRIE